VLDGDEFTRWRSEADRALQSAQVQAAAGLDNWACFAAEQSAQLAVKALLHGLGKGPWGRDLVRLGDRVREVAKDGWPADLDVIVRRLSRHYIPSRHPDAHPAGSPGGHYGPEEAQEAKRDAQRLIEAVDTIWTRLGGRKPHA